jgi:hypothetical protein
MSVYTPECEVLVDELLMTWKGQLSWKLYTSSQRDRFGIKSLSELCEAESCYIWNFILYVGLDTTFDNYLGNEPHGSKVVLELMVPILNQGYRVTMNNWFSSPDLYSKIYSKQTNAMGTLRQSRECPTK